MPTLRIDNQEVQVEEGATILDAARKLGIEIPTLCYREGCSANTSCLACVVRVNGGARLLPSCSIKAADGMAVESQTPEIQAARKTAIELLLADHAGDCQGPCQNICPAHMDIPTMIRQISAGRYRDALVTVKQHIALPAALGRICPELCEKGCRRASLDNAVSICRLKRFVADVDLATGEPWMPPCDPTSGKRVGIVGSGPTGLAAAWYLLQRGHEVVVIDEHPLPGGNMRYAAPRDLLPEDVLDAEINVVKNLGAQFRLGVRVERDVSLADLRKEFDAVLVAPGEIDATKAAALGLEMAGRGLFADKRSMLTKMPGVFAAGAAVTPFRHSVRAVGQGRLAAGVIHAFLSGLPLEVEPAAFTVRLGVLNDAELAAFNEGACPHPRAEGNARTNALTEELAVRESDRCLGCDCIKLHNCSLREWSIKTDANFMAYRVDRRRFERVTAHPTVVYESGKCISCGLCVQIAERAREPLGLTYIGRGFQVRIGVPLNGGMGDALQKVAEECVTACPTAALSFKREPARGGG